MHKYLLLPLCLAIGLAFQGCGSEETPQAEAPSAKVTVLNVQPQTVDFSENLPARVQAFRIAEIRPQVGGIIEKVLFTQGSEIKSGQALYKINSEIFQADVATNQAALKKTQSELERLKVQLDRYQQLLPTNAISKQEFSNAQAQYHQALADVAQMKATLTRQNINLQYATIRSPISGRIGQSFVTEGALVGQSDVKPLAIVQQIDKVYVDVKQSVTAYEKLQAALKSGKLSANQNELVQILNSQGTPYDVTAKMLFEDINVDPETGDVTIRIEVDNKNRKLLPGMYVRVKLSRSSVPNALLIPEQAIQYDQSGHPQVFILNNKANAELRKIELGQQHDQFYVVNHGLSRGDKVIVEGIDRIQPEVKLEATSWKAPVSENDPSIKNATPKSQGDK